MSKALKNIGQNNIANVSKRKNELKKISLELSNIDTDILDFGGVVLFNKEDFEKDPADWGIFINQEILSHANRDNIFNFRVVTATYSEEKEEYDIKEENIGYIRGGELLNYSNKLFVNISFADIVRIEGSAVFGRFRLGYVFIKK